MASLTVTDIIRLLDLKPHPERGHFRETFRDTTVAGGRTASTAIYFLLARAWQAAESLGDWTLAGCTVAPGFEFSGFDSRRKTGRPTTRRVKLALPEPLSEKKQRWRQRTARAA